MRKRSRWTRLLAMILAVAMVLTSQAVTALADGFMFGVVDDKGGQSDTGQTGSDSTVVPPPINQAAEETVNLPGTINGESVNLRQGPGTDYEAVTQLQSGDAVTVVTRVTVTSTEGEEQVWYRVSYGTEGAEAYVLSDFVTVSETKPKESESEEDSQVMLYSNGLENSIHISSTHTQAAPGTYVTLTGNITDEDLADGFLLRWQYSSDNGQTWRYITKSDGSFEEGTSYRFAYSDANAGYLYRLVVINSEEIIEVESNTLSVSRLSPKELADQYYGESAQNKQIMAEVSMSRSDKAGAEIKTGDTVKFMINYKMNSSPYYKYGDRAQPLVDEYKNTYITLTLPKGMTLSDHENLTGVTAECMPDSLGTETWKLTLDASLDTSANRSFEITVLVTGNGSTPVGTSYEIEKSDLSIYTEAPVVDKTNGQNEVVATYNQTNSASSVPAAMTSVTDDVWGIEKTPGKSSGNETINYEISEDGSTVVVYFTLKVGLTADGAVLSDPGNYERVGRVPLDGKISLTETPVLTDRKGESVYPKKITITENWENGQSYTFNGVQIQNGSVTTEVDTDTCQGNTNSGTVDGAAPFYSTYTVAVEYPNEGINVDFSENPNADTVPVENDVALTYTLLGENNARKDTAEANLSIGSVNQPAELRLEKYIETYNSTDRVLYTRNNLQDRKNAPEGAVTFTVTYQDSQEGNEPILYKKQNGKYVPLENNTVTIDPDTDPGTAVIYLAPGSYTVTETSLPTNVTGSDSQDVALTAGKQSVLKFVNKEKLGSVKITKKIEGTNKRLPGAEFTLYLDKSCLQAVETITTDATGAVVFQRLTEGTYYVKETKVPSGYIGDTEKVTEVTVTANETAEVTLENQTNAMSVQLQKWVLNQSGGTYVEVNQSNHTTFNGCFTIERFYPDEGGQEGEWKPVDGAGNLSLNTSGVTNPILLPVYQEGTKEPVQYRFAERLPDGWHGENAANEVGGYYYQEFTLKAQSQWTGRLRAGTQGCMNI